MSPKSDDSESRLESFEDESLKIICYYNISHNVALFVCLIVYFLYFLYTFILH